MEKHAILIPGWVYNLADYRQMFDLSDEDLKKRILNVPGGISSVNAQLHEMGHSIVSGDPHYHLDHKAMSALAEEVLAANEKNLRENLERLKNSSESALIELMQNWRKNKDCFLEDYSEGRKELRYQEMNLPQLPFGDQHFELLLCTDLLFHANARGGLSPEALMAELTRVALEVRIFPILDEGNALSSSIGPLMLAYQKQDFGIELREVPYETKRGANAMLRMWSNRCAIKNPEQHV
jgi:hypothetical protein